ncbi:SPRY domain-containing protein [Sporomusa malonica]|uniref:SPRY domain-containing protein n=1 Tax=Sporomusa malonica TaxID=112901 RepID=A0A1W2BGV0_9FIRM|nr:SPRY domain-containing protein [Sporomusa malonica]SMC72153.1 SPRY domain-containing protein [Sporomusa malonica]
MSCKWVKVDSQRYLLSNNDLTVFGGETVSAYAILADISYDSGKKYFEVKIDRLDKGGDPNIAIGVAIENSMLAYGLEGDPVMRCYTSGGNLLAGTNVRPLPNYGEIFTVGDVIGVALNLDDGILTFYKNGVSQGVACSDMTAFRQEVKLCPTHRSYGTSTAQVTANFGATPFSYPIPDGYEKWDSINDVVPRLSATAGDARVTLSWTTVIGATGYNVKRATTAGGPYTTIASNVTGPSYTDNAVTNGTTYYYVVTAITADSESGNSNEASATPIATSVEDENVLLRITMNDSSEREYKVSKTIADDLANWCNRTLGTGNSCFVFNKGIQNSKEYLFYEKIISFEVIPVA